MKQEVPMTRTHLSAWLVLLTVLAPSALLAEVCSNDFGVPDAQILSLRDKGMGWGEIGHVLAVSQVTGKRPSDVLKYRDYGMGWGEIVGMYGLDLGYVRGRAKGFAQVARAEETRRANDRSMTDLRDAPRSLDMDPGRSEPEVLVAGWTRAGDEAQAERLIKAFNADPNLIQDLRDDGMDWGEVKVTLAIAKKAGVLVSQVEWLRDNGMGWNRIAKKYGFSLKNVARTANKKA